MPEGDTIYRTAGTLRRGLTGRAVTAAATTVPQIQALGPQRLVGQRVTEVTSRGKHLLIWFAPSDLVLHTHLRMSGSWHLYRQGQRWRKPRHLARFRLDTDGWTAVCFSAPVCELLSRGQVERHRAIANLGPDLLDERFDLPEARRRLDGRADTPVGEALLDQRLLAGVGNVFKSEVLFLCGVDPWTTVRDLDPERRDRLLLTAERLLKHNARSTRPWRVTTGSDAGERLFVYGRERRPCQRCGTPIRARRQGEQARVTYWCPRCQPAGSQRDDSETPRR